MRYAVDPRQMMLFDPAEMVFSPLAIKHLRSDWPGLFRTQMLHLMPAEELGEHFEAKLGCHTKELYGMAGAVFLMGFFDLTIPEAVDRYMFDARWQYALNVNPREASLGHATLERYIALFVEDSLGEEVFHRVASAFIEALELDVSRQRLDSTHVFSDMATFGRTKLMGVVIKRFLTQLKRHAAESYGLLPDELRKRYAPSQGKLFADMKGQRQELRQTVAEDLLFLVNRFGDDESVANRSSYQAMARVLAEQCEVTEDKVEVKTKTGGDVMQNPSDPDATYDGHKGPGHQAQICETCSEENDVQLITGVETEPAHTSDQEAVDPMLDQLDSHDRKPEVLYADGGYGRDENVVNAEKRGVDLQSPTSGMSPQDAEALTVDDFVIDEETETVERCPNGCEPTSSRYDADKGETTTEMSSSDCGSCEFRSQCPVKLVRGKFVLRHTPVQRRLAARRAEQATDAFREQYAIRAGGESVNSGLKRRMGMGRLRIRGSPRVRLAVMLRCAGWNLFRALAAFKKRGIRDFAAQAGAFCAGLLRVRAHHGAASVLGGLKHVFPVRFAAPPLAWAA